MVSNNPVSRLTEDEYEYIAAVLEDEHYEFPLDKNEEYVLFTDWEGDEKFLPSVTIQHEVKADTLSDEFETIDALLSEYNWFKYTEINDIENDENGGISHAYFHGETIDSEVKEAVAETL